jgi:hypothetical protein
MQEYQTPSGQFPKKGVKAIAAWGAEFGVSVETIHKNGIPAGRKKP